MAGESIQFSNADNPATWQNILGSVARDFGQIAVSRLSKDEEETRVIQQAPMANSEMRGWIPWILGGVLVVVLLVTLRK